MEMPRNDAQDPSQVGEYANNLRARETAPGFQAIHNWLHTTTNLPAFPPTTQGQNFNRHHQTNIMVAPDGDSTDNKMLRDMMNVPKVITKEWALKYLESDPTISSRKRLLDRPFNAGGYQFTPITLPYDRQLGRRPNPEHESIDDPANKIWITSCPFPDTYPIKGVASVRETHLADPADEEAWTENYHPSCPFPDIYPIKGNVSMRHTRLAEVLESRRQRRELASRDPDEVVRVKRTPRAETAEDIRRNMAFLRKDPGLDADENGINPDNDPNSRPSKHDKVLKVEQVEWEGPKFPSYHNTGFAPEQFKARRASFNKPKPTTQQFPNQRAESAAPADRLFPYDEWDDLGNTTMHYRTQDEVNETYHQLLDKPFDSCWQEAFDISFLERQHADPCTYCDAKRHDNMTDPPERNWTTRADMKPVPRKGKEDFVYGYGKEEWEAGLLLFNQRHEEDGTTPEWIDSGLTLRDGELVNDEEPANLMEEFEVMEGKMAERAASKKRARE